MAIPAQQIAAAVRHVGPLCRKQLNTLQEVSPPDKRGVVAEGPTRRALGSAFREKPLGLLINPRLRVKDVSKAANDFIRRERTKKI